MYCVRVSIIPLSFLKIGQTNYAQYTVYYHQDSDCSHLFTAMSSFCVDCTGQIEKAEVSAHMLHLSNNLMLWCQFGPLDGLYCRYGFHFGADWSIAAVSFS